MKNIQIYKDINVLKNIYLMIGRMLPENYDKF